MKLKQAIHKRDQIILSLQDFLNYALRCGYDVNNNLKHWIGEYEEYVNESRRQQGLQKDNE